MHASQVLYLTYCKAQRSVYRTLRKSISEELYSHKWPCMWASSSQVMSTCFSYATLMTSLYLTSMNVSPTSIFSDIVFIECIRIPSVIYWWSCAITFSYTRVPFEVIDTLCTKPTNKWASVCNGLIYYIAIIIRCHPENMNLISVSSSALSFLMLLWFYFIYWNN